MLQSNLKAPVFRLTDIFKRTIDLNEYQDKKVFIGFFRHAGCPFCNLRVHTLTRIYEELKAQGMEMIFFFESPERVLLRSTFHQEVSPIPLISDPEKIWYNAYGLESSGYKSAVSHLSSFVQTAYNAIKTKVPVHMMAGGESIKTMPAEFLIDKGLMIKKVHYAERLNDRLDISVVKDFARTQ
ncbi:redoxin domain-containing protein [Fulvivirga ulvae]|uniref:redoxin domain-containing protein n=1 Tax=Fulvivirga ulvae TaxID=2904245 RepID=UPI001F46B62A|nr:redoxin domain-containing protein [Fulvivirga ulvae]UII32948.1 redoxin domain-containing protein [Fulvivirga ulvae]